MAERLEIRWVEKNNSDDPSLRVAAIGGKKTDGRRWQMTQAEAIRGVQSGMVSFYVRRCGMIVDVVVSVTRFGHAYLRTIADTDQPENLLSLPDRI